MKEGRLALVSLENAFELTPIISLIFVPEQLNRRRRADEQDADQDYCWEGTQGSIGL
ncbi:MAG: hypothetical protein WB586_01200 [Chthoniobacterales bacterium]